MTKQPQQREVAQVPVTWLLGSFACGPLLLWLLKRLQSSPEVATGQDISEYITPIGTALYEMWPGVVAGLVLSGLFAIAVNIRFAFQTRTQRFAIFAACEVAFLLGCGLGLWLMWQSATG